jgi:transcriptional regulator with XRE-family HTH domain
LPTDHIGLRIAYWRKRRGGMTQSALAGLAGVSQAYISKVESGRKGIERRAILVAIASALQVTVADLLGQPGDPTDPLKADAAAAVPAIRVALIEIEEGERRTPAHSPAQLSAAVERLAGLRARSDYTPMAGLLPDLLTEAAAHGGLPLARVGYETSVCLRNLGYRDLSLPAARVALLGAKQAGHRAWIGAAEFIHTLALPVEAAGITSRVAERRLAALQTGSTDPDVRQMLGQLHLSAALACAVDGRPDDARTHMSAAVQEARTLGDPNDGCGFNLIAFGPTNVGLWQMSVDAELGDHGKGIELARSVEPRHHKVASRHEAYWLTLGRALTHSGKTDRQALVAFINAERAAPTPFSLNPVARNAVMSMVNRARQRSVPDELRILVRRLGVEAGT